MSGGNTGTIKITLQMDEKGSIRILQEVGKASSNAGRDGKKAFDDMDASTKALTGSTDMLNSLLLKVGAGFSAYKIVDHVKDVALAGARYETLGVVMNNVGKIAGYNVKELDMYAEGVKNSGIQMDIARETITRLSQAHIGLEHASTLAKIAQDAAVIGNINSSHALEQMVYGIQTAQIEVLKTIGLNVNFEDSYKRLAKQLGKSMADLDETEKTQARLNVVMERGADIAGTYEAAMGTAGKQITSFPRYLKDFEISMGTAFNPATADVVSALTDTMKLLTEEIVDPENQRALAGISQRIADWVVSNNDLIKQDLPTYIKNTTGAVTEVMNVLGQVKSIYDAVPSEISGPAGVGIVGAIIFGGAAGKFLGMMVAVNQGMAVLDNDLSGLYNKHKKAAEAIQKLFDITRETISGKRDWWTGAWTEKEVDNQLSAARLSQWKDVINEISVTQVKADETVKKSITSVAEVHDAASEKKKKNTVDVAKVETDLYAKSKLTAQERFDFGLKLLKTEYDTHIKTGVSKNVADRWYNDQYQNLVEKRAETSKKTNAKDVQDSQRTAAAIASAMDSMYRDLKLRGNENYEYQKGLLDAQAEKYREMGVSNELVERWFTERHRLLKEQQILDSDNFFAGVRIGLQRNQDEFQTWAQRGLDITEFATKGMRKSFSDSLFAALKGDIDSISQVWNGFMDSMLHKLTDTVAEMAINWGIGAIKGVTGWWDTGAWEVKKDHVAVVHQGEMIVPADIASVIRSGSGSPDVSDLAQVSPSGGHEWSDEFKAFAKGTGGTYVPIAAQGLSLMAQGKINVGDFLSGILSPEAMITSVMSGGIPTMVNEYMGMRTSDWGTTGQTIANIIGGIVAGPIGAMVLGSLGGIVGMGLGDALDMRSDEATRDAVEDAIGWAAGNKAYSRYVGSDPYGYSGQWSVDDIVSGYQGYGDRGYSSGSDYSSYERESSPGGMGGYAGGGLVDRLMVPRGEDGWAPLQFTEGVVSKRGMETLENINSGNFNAVDISELIAEIRMFRLELRQKNHPLVMAAEKTAKYTEISVRRQVAV